jgi:hypothetical protein
MYCKHKTTILLYTTFNDEILHDERLKLNFVQITHSKLHIIKMVILATLSCQTNSIGSMGKYRLTLSHLILLVNSNSKPFGEIQSTY